MLAHLHDPPPRASVTPGVPRDFDRVLARALAKAPEDRYPSAGDFGRAALAAAEGRSVTEEERSVARGAAAPTVRRERLWSGASGPIRRSRPSPAAEAAPPGEPAPIRTTARGARAGCGPGRSRRRRDRRGGASRSRSSPAARTTPPPGDAGLGERGRAAGELVRLRLRRRGRGADLAAADLRRPARQPDRPPERPRGGRRRLPRASSRASQITGFELSDLEAEGGAAGRATAHYRATYAAADDHGHDDLDRDPRARASRGSR